MNIKINFLTIVIIILTTLSSPLKSSAIVTVADIPVALTTGLGTISTIYNGYQELKSAISAAENITKIDFKDVAALASGDFLGEITNAGLDKLKEKGFDKNVLSGGQIVTDSRAYLRNIRDNATKVQIRIINDTPSIYQADNKEILARTAQQNNSKTSKAIQNFTLPGIISDEICNSNKLKKTINYGDRTFFMEKKPVDFSKTDFTNIDNLCEANINEVSVQKAFITLYLNGYAGERSRLAAANPGNSKEGQRNLTLIGLEEEFRKNKEGLETLGKVTGTVSCVDKNGKKVENYDPRLNDGPDSVCDNFVTTIADSAASAEKNIASSRTSLINSVTECIKNNKNTPPEFNLANLSNVSGCLKTINTAFKEVFGKETSDRLTLRVGDILTQLGNKEQANKDKIQDLKGKNLEGIEDYYDEMIALQKEKADYYGGVILLLQKVITANQETNKLKSEAGTSSIFCPIITKYVDQHTHSRDTDHQYHDYFYYDGSNSDKNYSNTNNGGRLIDPGYECADGVLTIKSDPKEDIKKETSYFEKHLDEKDKKSLVNKAIKTLKNIDKLTKGLANYKVVIGILAERKEAKENGTSVDDGQDEVFNTQKDQAEADAPNEGTILKERAVWDIQTLPKDVPETSDKSEQRKLLIIKNKTIKYLNMANDRKKSYKDLIEGNVGGSVKTEITDTSTEEKEGVSVSKEDSVIVQGTSNMSYQEAYCNLVFWYSSTLRSLCL